MWAWVWEIVARYYFYDPARVIPSFTSNFWAGVESFCGTLSAQAMTFYQAFGYCLPPMP